MPGSARSAQRGQVVVIVAMAMIAIVGMVAIILEGGNAFAQQRVTQNAADAASNAGAVVLAERLGGAPRTDADVAAAVAAIATANTLPSPVGRYTNINGQPVDGNGVAVALASAKVVGSGDPIPATAAGVHVGGTRSFGTFFARVLGFDNFNASADATAVSGVLAGICPADAGCGILPVTFPVVASTCDGTNSLVPGQNEWPLTRLSNPMPNGSMAIVPLCQSGPGSVGWLDLGPGNLAQEIVDPTHRAFDVPTWLQTKTGNVNSVEDEINDNYAGKIILIPLFDGTCKVLPAGSALGDCGDAGTGVGNNTWYHIPKFTAFFLDRAYIQGSNKAQCNSAPGSPFVGGNGGTSCLKGWFVRYITEGPVQAGNVGTTDPDAIGVQLIR